MQYLLLLFIILPFILSSDGRVCGQVEFGMRDSNVCCHQNCTQCGEEFCAYSFGGNNDIGTVEGSYNCCKSYIRRENKAVIDEPIIYCNSTNSAPCKISYNDMIEYGYKFDDDSNIGDDINNNWSLSEIIMICIIGLLLLALSLAFVFICYRVCFSEKEKSELDTVELDTVEVELEYPCN